MRKAILFLTAVLAFVAPRALADTVTFTCTRDNNNPAPGQPCLVPTPTAPNVTFPTPTLDITWNSQTVDLTLLAGWLDTDSYSWLASNNAFFIFDNSVTSGPGSVSSPVITMLPPDPSGFGLSETGDLSFKPGGGGVPMPEPGSSVLLLLGIGIALVMRKRIGQRLPQGS
jgi:hypothetical protein